MVAEYMEIDAHAGSQDDHWLPGSPLAASAAVHLASSVAETRRRVASLLNCSAREPFTQRQANELLAMTREACAADSAECVSVLLQASAAALRCADAALDALVAAAAAGAPRALAAVLASPELEKHMEWRGPSAAPMLATALADAMKASLASNAGACPCFHALLRALDAPPGAPAAAARAALGPHMRGVYRAAAAAGARGALQALLVCLPEHCEALDASALDAAVAAGYTAAADDISLLLALRLQAAGPAAAAGAAPAAAAACDARAALDASLDSPAGGGAPDVCVFIDTAGSWSSPGSASCVSPACGGAAPRSSISSMGSSSAGSDCGYGGPCGPSGGPGAGCNGASGVSSVDGGGWGRHPHLQRLSSGSGGGGGGEFPAAPHHPASPTAEGGHGRARTSPPPAEAAAAARRAALRQAVGRDDVAAAAQLLTQLVDSTTAAATAADAVVTLGGGAPDQQQRQQQQAGCGEQLDSLILDLLGIAATTNAADCANLVLTAVGANDDPDLQARAGSALCGAAAAAGRCALLRAAAARHAWVGAALSDCAGALARRCLRAALLRGHHHTAVWLARRVPAAALVRSAVEALRSTPAWELQKETSEFDAFAARAAALLPPGSGQSAAVKAAAAGAAAAAAPNATALVAAFEAAWLSATGERLA